MSLQITPRMKLENSLREIVARELAPTLRLLKQMVAVNSFTRNRSGVDRLGRLTAEQFAPLGFTAESVPSSNPDYGDHVVLTRRGDSGQKLGLISHLDTVFPPDEEIRNKFVWQREGDRIYGPGTVDIKGGTALIHLTLSALKEAAPKLFEATTWVVLLNSSEEVLSPDFGALCRQRLEDGALAALVFEGEGRVNERRALVTARKGRATFDLKVEGHGAHAGSHHHRGANSIVQIAEAVQSIGALTDYSKGLTVNVGSIAGGTVVNRVPHRAVAEIELRAFTPEVCRQGIDAVMAWNGRSTVRSAQGGRPCRVSVELTGETPSWPRNAETDRLFELWHATGNDVGVPVEREERGGISDANYIWETLPTLDGLGPWGDHAHCSERSADGSKQPEYVDVNSMVPKATLNAAALARLLAGGG